MVTKTTPSLSVDNFVTDPKKQASIMFVHFMNVRHNDSVIFSNQKTNINEIRLRHIQEPEDFANALQNALLVYYRRMFDNVSVRVNATNISNMDYTINLDLSFSANGESYNLANVLFVNPVDSVVRLQEQYK